MIDALKFVQGAISNRSVISPELTHYRIANERIVAYNGHLALSSPIPLDITACPKADLFYKAIQACSTKTAISMTPNGRLSISSGTFRAYIPCLDDVFFDAQPQGTVVACPDKLVEGLEAIQPFIGEDASRPWAMGVLISTGMLCATNNVVFAQYWLGDTGLPTVCIPRFAVNELLRCKLKPISMQSDGSSVTFHFEGDRWLRTQLYDASWPFDRINSLFPENPACLPTPAGLADAVETLAAFAENKGSPLYFRDGGVGTHAAEGEGAFCAVEGLPMGPIFNLRQMQLLAAVAKEIDWSAYPRPCTFYGEGLRGLVLGRSQ